MNLWLIARHRAAQVVAAGHLLVLGIAIAIAVGVTDAWTNVGAGRSLLVALVALLAVTGCQAAAPPAPASSPTAAVVIQPSPTASCPADEVRGFVLSFIDAFNRGEDPARFFAPAPDGPISEKTSRTHFRWYSASGGPPNIAIYERSQLAAYFARRHVAGERWSLVKLIDLPHPPEYPRADFGIVLTRTAPDIAPRGPVEGKSAVNCAERTILVLTM